MFDVSASCVIKLMQRVDATGDCQPRKFGGHKRYALAEHEDKVRALVAEKPDLTITELWQKITAHGIKAGRSAVARFLLHLQLTFKKNSACRRAGTPGCQGRPRRLARDAEKP
jgi:transposase